MMSQKNLLKISCIIAFAGFCLTGCAKDKSDAATANETDTTMTSEQKTKQDEIEKPSSGTTENQTAENDMISSAWNDNIIESGLFSDRDLSGNYDESAAIKISLNKNSAECSSANVDISDTIITIKSEGVYIISGELDDGMVIVDADKKDKVQLVLCNASINKESSAAIYVKGADKVFITPAYETENYLSGGTEYVAIDENNIDATIFSKSDVTLNGLGRLNVSSASGHGICSKDDLTITGGSYTIEAAKKGLVANDNIDIASGTFDITVKDDGLHCENGDDATKGNINFYGGDFTIASGDDGIHAGNILNVFDGNINITKSYEGLEALKINVAGGDIKLVSSDDGFNAAGGKDKSGFGNNDDWGFGKGGMDTEEDAIVNITGGKIYVNADGDGLDSNGYLNVSGGEIYVDGPTNNGNGALDFGISSSITGGTIIALGASGMAEGFTNVENQGAILTVVDNAPANTEVLLLDDEGKELISYTASKAFNSVVISTPDIELGKTYRLKTGDSVTEITMDTLNYKNNPGGMGGFGGQGGGHGGHMKPDFDDDNNFHQKPDFDDDNFHQKPDGNGGFHQKPNWDEEDENFFGKPSENNPI